jgi:hypothetical protein
MNSPQPPFVSLIQSAPQAGDAMASRWLIDEDVALGCECANPALQIDCWGQEPVKPKRELY